MCGEMFWEMCGADVWCKCVVQKIWNVRCKKHEMCGAKRSVMHATSHHAANNTGYKLLKWDRVVTNIFREFLAAIFQWIWKFKAPLAMALFFPLPLVPGTAVAKWRFTSLHMQNSFPECSRSILKCSEIAVKRQFFLSRSNAIILQWYVFALISRKAFHRNGTQLKIQPVSIGGGALLYKNLCHVYTIPLGMVFYTYLLSSFVMQRSRWTLTVQIILGFAAIVLAVKLTRHLNSRRAVRLQR